MKWPAAAVAVLSFTLVLVACGTTRALDATQRTSRSASKRERPASFAAQASSICSAMDEAAKELVASTTHVRDREMAELVGRWRADMARLAQLSPPPAKQKPFRLMLENYRLMLSGLAAAQASQDEGVLSDLAAATVGATRGSRAARHAGLRTCAFFPEIRQPPRDSEPIVTAAVSLLVRGARLIKRDCDADSCRIEFSGTGPTRSRLREVTTRLRANGWSHVRTGRSPVGTTWATANRNDLAAEIEILGHRPQECANAPSAFGCTDAIWVHREQVPSILTDD